MSRRPDQHNEAKAETRLNEELDTHQEQDIFVFCDDEQGDCLDEMGKEMYGPEDNGDY